MKVNDYVVYNTEGICKIVDEICPEFVKDRSKQYYVLVPIDDNKSKTYLPIENAEHRCRKLITTDAARELMDHANEIASVEISDEREREIIYRNAVQDGDLKTLIGILKTIYSRKHKREINGKNSTAVDDKYYAIADRNLCNELAFVLHLSPDDVRSQLINKAG